MKRISPWLIAGLITMIGAVQAIFLLRTAVELANFIEQFIFVLDIALIAFIGALIVIRQSGNIIGWLMLAVALVTSLPIFYDPAFINTFFPEPPRVLSPGIWVLLWLQGWFWLVQMVLIFQIVLRFPNGKLLSTRWSWLSWVSVGILIVAAVESAFTELFGPINNTWEVVNPVGFMTRDVTDGISLLWVLGLLVLAAGSLVALVLRFRRGDNVSRQQIKWLLFAGVVLVIVAISGLAFFSVYSDSPAWLDIIVQIVLMTLPLAVANAILRYRLYDIDIIIRRTLSYSILTAALALIYFGAVALLQYMFGGLFSNSNSPLIIVISTLAIAALFNPLRSRIQAFIDRRFFRSKYDAEKALADFSAVARDEVDIVRLSGSLLSVIEKTIQPEQINLWLRETTREK
ncbi:MAG: hypothetical protein ACK2UW_12045 [Anaerolineales bacterium]